jgi:hypothetical protein
MKTLRFEKYEAVAGFAAVVAVSLAMFVLATVILDWLVIFR